MASPTRAARPAEVTVIAEGASALRSKVSAVGLRHMLPTQTTRIFLNKVTFPRNINMPTFRVGFTEPKRPCGTEK
jgi:hypothetical protein